MSKNVSDKYYQENKEILEKKLTLMFEKFSHNKQKM